MHSIDFQSNSDNFSGFFFQPRILATKLLKLALVRTMRLVGISIREKTDVDNSTTVDAVETKIISFMKKTA